MTKAKKMKMTNRERFVLLPSILLIPALSFILFATGMDLYLHNRDFGGRYGLNTLNIWGYRGDPAPKPSSDQVRIAVVGGSTAWGYGVPNQDSFPSQLQKLLKKELAPIKPILLNLAFNNEGAFGYWANLEDYNDLDYELAILYTGVNDSGGANYLQWRRTSFIFRSTGYLPILPEILRTQIGNFQAGRGTSGPEDPRIIFDPKFSENLQKKIAREKLDDYLKIPREEPGVQNGSKSKSTTKDFQKDSSPQHGYSPKTDENTDVFAAIPDISLCSDRWNFYCNQIKKSIDFMIGQGKRVLIVGEPLLSEAQAEQQMDLRMFLEKYYQNDPRILYADLGLAVDVSDSQIAFDGMHLTAEGNRQIATLLINPIKRIMDIK